MGADRLDGRSMRENRVWSVLLPLILIPAGGFLMLGLCFLGYLWLYLGVESLFFADDPGAVPADTLRNAYALALVVLGLAVVLGTRLPDLLKATILIGPLATLVVASILRWYMRPAAAIVATAAIALGCVYLLYRYRKPWFYYYAAAAAVAAGVAYAWPRP